MKQKGEVEREREIKFEETGGRGGETSKKRGRR